jgi:hypothetical protein
MGDHSRFLSSSGLRLLLRLVSVVAALVVLSVSSRAAAATLPAVPMCGERNESVAAPPIFRAAETGTIRALPCRSSTELGVGPSAPAAPERVIVYETPERVLAFNALYLADGESCRISLAVAATALDRPGFAGTPFRPPRA